MQTTLERRVYHVSVLLGAAASLGAGLPNRLTAQGCEPIRFTGASLGGNTALTQQVGEWRLTLGYRHLYSDQWYVGTSDQSQLAPGGRSPVIKIHSLVADLGYALTDRVTVRLAVPFSTGTVGRVWPDQAWHDQKASGIGDISVSADAWVLDTHLHPTANFSLGLAVQAPTGKDDVGSRFYNASGSVAFPADMSVQPGSGGWGVTLQTRGFAQLFDRGYGYLSGSYTFTPTARADIRNAPLPTGRLWSVADGYSSRAGLAYTAIPNAGLSVSLGGRIDGTPVHDVFGGGDDTVRRPGYVLYAEPGASLSRGANTLSVSVPLRLEANRLKSVVEQQNNALSGGGFARSLIFVSYSRRL